MSDNTNVPGGDNIRTIQRSDGVKREAVGLDLGGPGANPEVLITAGQALMAGSVPVVPPSDLPPDPVLLKIADLLTRLLPASPGLSSPFEQLAGSIDASLRSILAQMSPWQIQTPGPYPTGSIPFIRAATVAAAICTVNIPAIQGRTIYVSGVQITGGGATAASTVSTAVSGLIGDQFYWQINVPVLPAGIIPAFGNFNPPLPALPNTAVSIGVGSFGTGNLIETVNVQGYYL